MGYRIFAFEDNQELLELLNEVLQLKGDELICFQEKQPISLQVISAQPDVILVDLRMTPPGKEIIETLKADPGLSQIPILLFTATNIKSAEIKALGVDGVIPKPFSLEDIERIIDKTILKSRKSRIKQNA